jgi:ribosomal protein L11
MTKVVVTREALPDVNAPVQIKVVTSRNVTVPVGVPPVPVTVSEK